MVKTIYIAMYNPVDDNPWIGYNSYETREDCVNEVINNLMLTHEVDNEEIAADIRSSFEDDGYYESDGVTISIVTTNVDMPEPVIPSTGEGRNIATISPMLMSALGYDMTKTTVAQFNKLCQYLKDNYKDQFIEDIREYAAMLGIPMA